MAGPASSILLNRAFTLEDRQFLQETIQQISLLVEGHTFSVNQTAPIGGTYQGTAYPFGYSITQAGSEYWFLEDWQVEQIKNLFGFMPLIELSLWAGCNGLENHQILGELTLHLSKHYKGLVDFCGALLPKSIFKKHSAIWVYEDAAWEELEEDFLKMIRPIEGRIESIRYEAASGKEWVTHVADNAFMANWLLDKNFHMIK